IRRFKRWAIVGEGHAKHVPLHRSATTSCCNPVGGNYLVHLDSCVVAMGSSSVMYWVFPITPHIEVPVAACHFFDMLSPVWQPQLLIKAPRANTRPLIFFSSSSCSHDLQALSMLLL